jgi:hypothetical protein
MNVELLRWVRRAASAVVLLSALALILARTRSGAAGPRSSTPEFIAALCFLVSVLTFIVSWRRELATSERAAQVRERQQLELLKLQAERAKRDQAVP